MTRILPFSRSFVYVLFGAFFILFGMMVSPPAFGQASQPLKVSSDATLESSFPASQGDEITILRDDHAGDYSVSSLENLSKLYWRLGAFDFEDEQALTNFLKINECKLYAEYLNDDLEWREIIATMREDIKRKRDSYPLNFQFVLELNLGRYEPEKGGFPIINRTGFIDAKRIEVASIDSNSQICHDNRAIKDYPTGLIIILEKPFTLDFLKLDEHVAQAYILRKKSEYANYSEEERLRQYERNAYLRLRVTFSQYHGNLRGEEQIMAIVYGRIDGYEIFEDVSQKRLMYTADLRK